MANLAVAQKHTGKLAKAYHALARTRAKVREKGAKTAKAVMHVGLATGTAAILGAVDAKTGGKTLFKIPVPLAVAGVSLAGAIFDVGGQRDNAIATLTGAMSAYGYVEAHSHFAKKGTPAAKAKAAVKGIDEELADAAKY